jgi:hypothetical protein
MTPAEAALRSYARGNSLRVMSSNLFAFRERFRLQVRVRRERQLVLVHAGTSHLLYEASLSDRRFSFVVNHAYPLGDLSHRVAALRSHLTWPVFTRHQKDARLVTEWLRSGNRRSLIANFHLRKDEFLHVYVNLILVVLGADHDTGRVIESMVDLAAEIPAADPERQVDCRLQLPPALAHLSKHFKRFAISDDDLRQQRRRRTSKAVLSELQRDVEPLLEAIDEYLDSLQEPYHECALQLGYLAELVAELRYEGL